MTGRPRAWTRPDLAVVASLCAFGAAIRLPGLTSQDLWFDDAWAALPAHVGIHDALRMVVTTPLYTLALRSWIAVGPSDTWFAQLPALVLGVGGIAATYALVRAYGLPRLGAAAAAAVVAASPVTVTFSTRVKEYSCDLLLACLVLWLVERWRRDPTWARLWWLGAAGAAAMWISASTAAVVGGAAVLVVVTSVGVRRLRAQAAALVGVLAVASVALWLVFLRHLPGQLRTNWRTHGYLFGYASAHHVAFAFEQTFAGIAHGLVGIPIPYAFDVYPLRASVMTTAVVTAIVLVALVLPPMVATARARARTCDPTLAAAAAVVLAVIGTLAGVAPLGDGRTDEALYPAILLLGVSLASRLVRREHWAWARTHGARLAGAGLIAAAALSFGLTHAAAYPPTGLSGVWARLQPRLHAGEFVVLDGYESFTWGNESLGPWHVSFAQGAVPWPMGFHVASDDVHVILSRNYLQPDAQFATLHLRTHRIWFIGPTNGGYSTSAPHSIWTLPFPSPDLLFFLGSPTGHGAHGWRAMTPCCGEGSGSYAWLFVYRGGAGPPVASATSARSAAARTLGTGSARSGATAVASASTRRLATTLATISRTRQCSSSAACRSTATASSPHT